MRKKLKTVPEALNTRRVSTPKGAANSSGVSDDEVRQT